MTKKMKMSNVKKKREEKFIQHKRRWSLVRKEIEGQGIWTYEDMYKLQCLRGIN